MSKSKSKITQPQYNYLKGLMKKVGEEFYRELRLRENVIIDATERQLSKKQAQRLIGHLKAEADRRKAKPVRFGTGFEIGTPYGTTMLVNSDEELLQWARKRFKGKPHQLKKLEAFLGKVDAISVEASGYKIKRSFNDSN